MPRLSYSLFLGSFVALAGWLTIVAPAFGAGKKPDLPTPPPQAIEQTIRVRRSDSIEVPLRIYGTRAQTLEFRIRAAPRAGKLSAVRQVAPERAVVKYTPPADPAIDSDQFSYAARSKEGFSAAATVAIRILDDPAKLVVPAEIDFGTSIAGDEARQSLAIANEGGSMLEGTLRTDPPWSIDGPADYRLPAGGRTTFALRFQPRQKGPFRGEVRFSSDPTSATQLRGAAEAAIRFDPSKIELGYGAGQTRRTGAFAVTNRSASEVSLAFIGSDRLQFGRELKLAPHETQQVHVALANDDPLGLSAEIRAEPHGTIAIDAPPLPASLATPDTIVRLVRSEEGKETASIRVENRGGMAADARFEIGAPFTVQPAVVRVAPRESVNATITAPAPATDTHSRGELVVSGGATPLRIDVERAANIAQTSPEGTRQRHISAAPLVQVNNADVGSASARPLPDDPDGIFPQPIYPREIANGRAVIEWPAAISRASRFRAQEEQVSAAAGKLHIDWRDYPAFQAERKGTQIVGTLTNLQPGRLYIMRVVPILDDGSSAAPLVEVRFRTAPKKPSRFRMTPISVLLVLFCAGAALAVRQRFKTA